MLEKAKTWDDPLIAIEPVPVADPQLKLPDTGARTVPQVLPIDTNVPVVLTAAYKPTVPMPARVPIRQS